MSDNLALARQGGVSSLALNVLKLNAKIKRGDYAFNEVSCFCGDNKGEVVTTKDRYGIFYTMKLCLKCGILYAPQQMTEETSQRFYQEDYRNIYECGTKEDEWELGIERAKVVKELFDEHEIKPKVLFDIGCNMGQHLTVFDCEKYGVDYSLENIEYGKSKDIIHGGIEELEKLGKKADVIILSHVLEHFTDLRKELDRIKNLLVEDGYLYIEVPGLYTMSDESLFQNAHNWQFTTNTLTYVMNSCGWHAMYSDPFIRSIWRYTGVIEDAPLENEAKEIWEYKWSGRRILPSFSPTCKFPLKQRRENVKKSLSYKIKDISEIHEKETGKEAIIISGGPSIKDYVDKIKKMQSEGMVVVAIERMYQWCQGNGITPNYILVMDASDDVIESFGNIHPETIHILATQCNNDIFDRLKDENTYIYSSAQSNISFVDSWVENEYDKVTMLNTGGSVSLGCIAIAMFLGMKGIHVFGFDCHVTKDKYADGITGVGYIKDTFTIEVDGREFETTPIYVSFARQFFQMMKLGEATKLLNSIKIYGDSLIKAMSKIDLDGDKT